MRTNFNDNRPSGYNGKGDAHLPILIKNLQKLLADIQKNYDYDTLQFEKIHREILSTLIIEFAEDMLNDIGLWKSIEYYNNQLFNTPLPLFVSNEVELTGGTFDKNRVKFFIYTILAEFDPDLVLSPQHKDLDTLANAISTFLKDNFQKVPKDSSIKKYLGQPNKFGWDFKRKLVWIGTNSFLFRYSFYRYVRERNKGKVEIPIVDDFVCQENTIWSGLGIIDILAKALELPESHSTDVSTWYERHASYYKVKSIGKDIIELENIINNQIYKVMEGQLTAFKKDHLVFGSLVPYSNFWYWSGGQHDFGKVEEKLIGQIKRDFVKESARIAYRFDKELLKKAKEDVKSQLSDFHSYFGNDLVIFKDGLSVAAALQKKEKQKYESLPKKELEEMMRRHGLKNPFPNVTLPNHILNSDNGIALFFNPGEGIEIMMAFNDVLNGFKKLGNGLNEDEKEAIRNFIMSDSISPAFVIRMIKDYGNQSISASFLVNNETYATDYLLHRYKGHFYRNRYPCISYSI